MVAKFHDYIIFYTTRYPDEKLVDFYYTPNAATGNYTYVGPTSVDIVGFGSSVDAAGYGFYSNTLQLLNFLTFVVQ